MRHRVLRLLAAVAVTGVTAADSPPLKVDLSETTSVELVQVPIVLTGAEAALATLTPSDLEVRVGGHVLRDFKLDRIRDQSGSRSPRPTAPVSYMYYFDEPHLTLVGRSRSFVLAPDLAPILLDGASAISVVTSGKDLHTVQPFTEDVAPVHAGLAVAVADKRDWDFYAEQEETRVTRIRQAANDSFDSAKRLAFQYARDEEDLGRESVQRFISALSVFSSRQQPKVVLFFADTFRMEPGQHYLDLLGLVKQDRILWDKSEKTPCNATAGLTAYQPPKMVPWRFADIVEAANAAGVRVYAILGFGLTDASSRMRASERALRALAQDTGGRAFVRGESPKRIAEQVLSDLNATWVLSFPPADLPRSNVLPLSISSRVRGLTVTAQMSVQIPTRTEQLTRRLLGEFFTARSVSELGVETGLVPLTFEDGKYVGLLQVQVPASQWDGAVWDLGASLVSESRVKAEASGRISLQGGTAPVVLERTVSFDPGSYELVAVAREGREDAVSSTRQGSLWPDPKSAEVAAVSPISTLQPARAVFARQGQTRRGGSALRGPLQLQAGVETAFVSVVCRGATKRSLVIDRGLGGENAHSFAPIYLRSEDQCIQVRDVIPGDYLGAGQFRYTIDVTEQDREPNRLAELVVSAN